MKQLFKYLRQTDKVWRAIWLFIFCGFLSLDAFFPGFFGITLLKLFGLALCFIYVLQKYNEDRRLLLAFALTFIADILLAFNNASLFGIYIFILAQFTHFSRLKLLNLSSSIIIAAIITVAFLVSVLCGPYAIFLLGAIYAFFLFANIYLSFKWVQAANKYKATTKSTRSSQRPNRRAAYFAFYGFILFACCDFCAASSFFCNIHAFPFLLKRLFDFLCWAFYYPSQVLISCSGRKSSDHTLLENL